MAEDSARPVIPSYYGAGPGHGWGLVLVPRGAPSVPSALRGLEGSCHWGRHCSLLCQSFGGSLCHRAQHSGCHSLSNKQSRSAWLPSLLAPGGVVPLRPGPGCPFQVHVGWPLPPQSHAHLHSGQARLLSLFLTPPLTLSHSLSASFSQVLLFLAHACALPHRLIFSLPSPLPPGFWSLSLALSGAGIPPPPISLHLETLLNCFLLGRKKFKIKKWWGWRNISRFWGAPQP